MSNLAKSLCLISVSVLFCSQAIAEVVVVKAVLVKGHGGQFMADVVAEKTDSTPTEMNFYNLRLKTRYGYEYFLVNSGSSKPGQALTVSEFICKQAAPAGWYHQSYPYTKKDGTKGDAVYFNENKTAIVSPYNEFPAYRIRGSVTCSSEELMHIGE